MRLDEMGKRWQKKALEKWKTKTLRKGFSQRVFFKCSLNQIQSRATTQKSIINHLKGDENEDGKKVDSVFLFRLLRLPHFHEAILDDFKTPLKRRWHTKADNLSDGI